MRRRVLVVDDEEAVRYVLEDSLGEVYEVSGADNGAGALGKLDGFRPDVVLVDFNMPGGGGVRAANEIRAVNPDVRLVAISADTSQSAMFDMSRAGAVGYLVKGASDEEIVRVIRSAARF